MKNWFRRRRKSRQDSKLLRCHVDVETYKTLCDLAQKSPPGGGITFGLLLDRAFQSKNIREYLYQNLLEPPQ